MTNIFKKLIWC